MSQLIKLRNRIKAIETTKKVTHAMRLISMSSHTQLKGRHDTLLQYKNAVQDLFKKVQGVGRSSIKKSEDVVHGSHGERSLVLLVGSQKGLCGIFNTMLFSFFEKRFSAEQKENIVFVPIGKKALDYCEQHIDQDSIIASYDSLTMNNYLNIARQLTDMVMRQEKSFTSVRVFSNQLRGFFMQKPIESQLLPVGHSELKKNAETSDDECVLDYIWPQAPEEVVEVVAQQYFEVSMQYVLFQSLLAEHAARFLSMDSATRNAERLLEKGKIDYSKLRQAKITKELTELTGSFQAQ